MNQDQTRQGGVVISKEEFVRAVSDELIEHFAWTSVQGLVELEARSIAVSAYQRLLARNQ